ncbi:M23 family metallopeptidase [Motilibacter deserti]|uniref:M23 family metallopeptidase n=1 Tax=Motilibacter deserti TaxID=2714956 RepID=A0ABX0GY84_9ACTN|nr:M23 family metallopeptidase [Motilibacter deserti]NHC14641.1 M23 family metallopeptidase [Motilibacter deserti]
METSAVGASTGMSNVMARISGIQSQLAMLSRPTVAATVVSASPAAPSAAAGTASFAGRSSSGAQFAAALQSAVSAAAPTGGVAGPGATGSAATAPVTTGPVAPGPVAPAPAATAPGATTAADAWTRPVDGRVTSKFGMRTHPVTGVYKLHTGTDFSAPMGSSIGAASSGVVKSAGWQGGYGNTVVIDHGDGITTMYAHASELLVKPGQRVEPGDTVAKAGSTGLSTGPHLHFEVREDNKPVDPQPWLRKHGVTV